MADEYPLSFAQERLWLYGELQPDSPAYHESTILRLGGSLDVAALRRAFVGAIHRHESLRTSFPMVDGAPVQRVTPADHPDLARFTDVLSGPVDVRDQTGAELARQVEATVDRWRRQPFDVGQGPLLRVGLIQLPDQEWVYALVVHHLVFDGWSSALLTEEINQRYAAIVAGRLPELSPLSHQYPDYAADQRRRLGGEALDERLDWWRHYLSGVAPVGLTADLLRPADSAYRGDRRVLELPIGPRLAEVGRQERVTTYQLLLAAFGVLLSRYTDRDDLVIGTPVADRGQPWTQQLIGFFVNTVPLRLDLSGDPTFRTLLRRVRDAVLAVSVHQEAPIERIAADLGVDGGRDLRRNPLFEVMFTLQNSLQAEPRFADATVVEATVVSPATFVDLDVCCLEYDGGIRLEVNFDRDVFRAETIAELTAAYQTLLTAALDRPETPVSELPLVDDAGRQRLHDWARTAAPVTEDPSVWPRFAAVVRANPSAPALEAGPVRLSYGELDVTVAALARRLRAAGIGRGDVAAVALHRGAELVVTLLAILRAGATYLPLDPDHPAARLRQALADHAVGHLFTSMEHHAALTGLGVPLWLVDDVCQPAGGVAEAPGGVAEVAEPLPEVVGDDVAYLLYTSGSTGRPKAVAVRHRSLAAVVTAEQAVFQLRSTDRALQFAMPTFDASLSEIFTALLAGATLVVARGPADRTDLVDLVREHRVTVVQLPPSVLALLRPEDLPKVRLAVVGGEACPPQVVTDWADRLRLVNAYGPTEATITACAAVLGPVQPGIPAGRPPIGGPLPGVVVRVLDRYGRLVPPGAPGELHVGGPGVAVGYVADPELTAARFVADRHGSPGERLYRTGDRVRLRPDGQLEFLGRLDDQVKLRGLRIEPGEIEAALREHPEVRQAVVVIDQGGSAGGRLVAYVVPASGSETRTDRLRDWLRERVPSYLVPEVVVPLAELPLGRHGKIDRRALPAVAASPGSMERYRPPSNPAEERIAQIWAEVLGVPKVGLDDDFFGLGGHSLLASTVVAHTRDAFACRVPLRTLFDTRTLGRFADAVTELVRADIEQLSEDEIERLLTETEGR